MLAEINHGAVILDLMLLGIGVVVLVLWLVERNRPDEWRTSVREWDEQRAATNPDDLPPWPWADH